MRSLLSQLLAVGPELAAYILTSPILNARTAHAYTPTSVPSPNLDLSNLGRVALAGSFDSISLYQYAGQNEATFNTNGSQSLLSRYPDGTFRVVASSDAYIMAMCPFNRDGALQGIVVGGNFTRLGDQEAQGVALYNPNDDSITGLPGLSGSVDALYCDDDSGTVYVGGAFTGANSSNALAWTTGWTNLPFQGFNGPVASITKNSDGNIVFGGDFDGLGNTTTPNNPDQQVIALSSGSITSSGTSSTDGFNNATNIICKTGDEDGPGNTWLLADNTAGWWEGTYSFGFNPTMLRLYNTMQDGRGTRSWYFENLNSGGILNMEYTDADGNNQSCSSNCPLAQNSSAQDFHFVPPVGMNSFRVYVTDWYGSGGGLAGIEMFQNDIYSFAVNSFNEPACDDVSNSSSSTATPSSFWVQTPNLGQSTSDYLTATLNDASNVGSNVSVVFSPNVAQSGNYSITVFTPGCLQDNSCTTRGRVNITGSMTSGQPPVSTILYQTNDYDKYDQFYYGYIDVSDAFQPQVTLSPDVDQAVPLTVVAQRVGFELTSSNGGLNGLFEYDPNEATVSTDFTQSAIDTAGMNLDTDAAIMSVISHDSQVFVAGNFSSDAGSNIMSVSDNATSLPGDGLNGVVSFMELIGDALYIGGNFTDTQDGSENGLNSIAVYITSDNSWSALGAGVNGMVSSILPLSLNISMGDLQDCLAISGHFTTVYAFGGNSDFDATGFAVWVLSEKNWLSNLPNATISVSGQLTASVTYSGTQTLYAGQILSQSLGSSDAVELIGSGQPQLMPLGIRIQPSQASGSSSMRKRALNTALNYTGVYDGLYYSDNDMNITVLGGRFSATASNGSTIDNLIFINNTESTQTITGISGLDTDSTFVGMDTNDNVLYAGGAVSGTIGDSDVNGLIAYDLVANAFASPQPPALAGDNVVVNAVAVQPDNANVYVGGDFQRAGSLPCAVLCYYDTTTMQWNTPGTGLDGTITAMQWTSKTTLVIAGNLTVGGNQTTMATYDADQQSFQEYQGAGSLPGTISALTPADGSSDTWWVAGTSSSDSSAFLSKYDDGNWNTVNGLGAGTDIRGLQLIALTDSHDDSDLMPSDMVLMITGNINVPDFGNASAVLYNGTTVQPFILTNVQDGSQGSLSQVFVSEPQNFMSSSSNHLALGLVVLIGLAIALGLIFLIVVAGIFIERSRRRREGYVPMAMDRNGQLARIPPETLLANVNEKGNPPKL